MPESLKFYARGKLLLSGEYFVLDGAKALALPTRYGQSLEIFTDEEAGSRLIWESRTVSDEIFLRITFSLNDFELLEKEGEVSHYLLQDLLREARKRNPDFLQSEKNIRALSRLEFPLDWGLGSSSTLVYNIGQWSKTDPFDLLFATLEGSGYDVACAGAQEAVLYHLDNGHAVWRELCFEPPFAEQVYFIHLGKKQNSSEAVRKFRNAPRNAAVIEKISDITARMIRAVTANEFRALMEEHEAVMAGALGLEKVKTLYFSDFPGAVKSLGAWGGDFVMALAENKNFDVEGYFRNKGFQTVIGFKDIIFLNKQVAP